MFHYARIRQAEIRLRTAIRHLDHAETHFILLRKMQDVMNEEEIATLKILTDDVVSMRNEVMVLLNQVVEKLSQKKNAP